MTECDPYAGNPNPCPGCGFVIMYDGKPVEGNELSMLGMSPVYRMHIEYQSIFRSKVEALAKKYREWHGGTIWSKDTASELEALLK